MQLLISKFVDAFKYNNRSVLDCIGDFFDGFQNGFNDRRVLASHFENDFIWHAICYCIYYANFPFPLIVGPLHPTPLLFTPNCSSFPLYALHTIFGLFRLHILTKLILKSVQFVFKE